MSSPRSGVRCVNHEGRLVVLGGYNGRERLCSVERYVVRLYTLFPATAVRNNVNIAKSDIQSGAVEV